MKNFKLMNLIGGWAMFAIALMVYTLTLEPSVSLWDCGEFISAAYRLQVVHPPGAPFFLMIGRLFSLLADSPEKVGFWVNMLSAVSSAGCVMFTFWITTHFADRIVSAERENRHFLIIASGVVAALTNTFIDSFWFSAVEAEVYALSSFFTALTFWAILRWDRQADSPNADRWLVFIGFITGLALGTHMLNLLVIPAVCLAYYFRRYQTSAKGVLFAFGAAVLALGFVMKIIYPGIPWLISRTDKLFVNDFGMPFYSGAIFSVIAIFVALAILLWYTHKKGLKNWNTLLLSITFIIVGYSSYAMVIIRSMANPAIDMNNPEDPYKFYGYITREQYGDRPLVKGPFFNAPQVDYETTHKKYFKGEKKYEEGGENYEPVYDDEFMTLFPRMGKSNKPADAKGFREWGGMGDVQAGIEDLRSKGKLTPQEQQDLQYLEYEIPTMGNNLQFFFKYQIGHMYIRYFMWNFVGRFNDQQAVTGNTRFDGNWFSGIGPVDRFVVGPKKDLPDYYQNQKGRNAYYFLPLLLGILGLLAHYSARRKDFWLVMTLFLFTGVLINVYMNQPPYEPRERDYSLVGSFQTFCIWVGLGVIAVADLLTKKLGKNAAIASAAACTLLVPVNMAYQNWDDHDRSGRYIGIDMAKNFLNQLEPNAILFCNGDNDTYPLWYAQNVEGIRTDVRIINQSLLPTEWYSSVLLDKVYDSEPLPLTVTKRDLQTGSFEYGVEIDRTDASPKSLRTLIDELVKANRNEGSESVKMNGFSAYLPIDREAVIKSGIVSSKDYGLIEDTLKFNIGGNYITKGDIVVYDLITTNAAQGWKRPIYFTSVSGYDFNFLNSFLQLEGLVYKFVPINGGADGGQPRKINDYKTYQNLVHKYRYYGMKEKKNFYLDDKAAYVPGDLQQMALILSKYYYAEVDNYNNYMRAKDSIRITLPPPGFKDVATFEKVMGDSVELYRKRGIEVIHKMLTEMPEKVCPIRRDIKTEMGITLINLGDVDKGKQVLNRAMEECVQFAKYFSRWDDEDWAQREIGNSQYLIQQSMLFAQQKGLKDLETKYKNMLQSIAQ